jgi:oligoribonuclease NrnB/cAMP/cGMP phosphodiesterase (DHH superfamily)
MENLQDVVVMYHGSGCKDGFGSAYAAWKKFADNATYIPMDTRGVVPEGLVGKEIYILDYSFDRTTLQDLVDCNTSVVVIDHHISAKEDVTAFPNNIFDNNHSGAVLSWQYFHPETTIPPLLEYVEDHDIWKFALPNNREFNAALGEYEMDFGVWDTLITDLEDPEFLENFLTIGATIAQFEDKLVQRILKSRERVLFEGHEVWAINADKTYRSILGHELASLNEADGMTALGIVYYRSKGQINISLRSNGDVDVSVMAQKYGGGGHKNAASIKADNFTSLPFTFVSEQ